MTATHRADSQLATLGVLRHMIGNNLYGEPPPVEKLAQRRHMTYQAVRLHLVYLLANGYIERRDGKSKSWRNIVLTAKGEVGR